MADTRGSNTPGSRGRGGNRGGRNKSGNKRRDTDKSNNAVTTPHRPQSQGEQDSVSTFDDLSVRSVLESLQSAVNNLSDEIAELRGENVTLKAAINAHQDKIISLEQELDDLQQYGRRENVCFSNLKYSDQLPAVGQVIELCEQINVTVSEADFVDVHPLPSKNGHAKRVIARFKDRKLAQKVMSARKASKNISPNKKQLLAADASRGFGIQPNITPKRAALLSQAKKAVEQGSLNGSWIDIKTGAVLVRLRHGDRPRVIRKTSDILKLVPSFQPNDYFFCVRGSDKFEVFDPYDSSKIDEDVIKS